MAIAAQVLAQGEGWRVTDVICDHGPRDRPFEEQHATMSIAAVTAGTFQYRTRQGHAMLVPGAVLLGNAGACFECGHEHAQGDRCLAFHFTPAYFEAAVEGTPRFAAPSLPPQTQLLPLLAAAESARDAGDIDAFEELAVQLAGAVLALQTKRAARRPSARDERRVTSAVRRIEAEAHEPLTLTALAREAGMSPYHFLRTFRHVTGMTPRQYVLRTRLMRAAVRLHSSAEAVSEIAYAAGFNDLSTFNRRFRKLVGVNPARWRQRR
jgi:AraC family transcriptional regulator